MGQVFSATMVLDTYAGLAVGLRRGRTSRTGALGSPVLVRRAPVGVAAGIIPWNVPLFISALKLGPAMAAGCPIVLKPAPETPLDAYLLAEAVAEADLPPGVINIVAAGRETGEHLVRHPGIDKVSLHRRRPRSASTSARSAAACSSASRSSSAASPRRSCSTTSTLDETMLGNLVMSGLMNNGQVCGAQSRILVSEAPLQRRGRRAGRRRRRPEGR